MKERLSQIMSTDVHLITLQLYLVFNELRFIFLPVLSAYRHGNSMKLSFVLRLYVILHCVQMLLRIILTLARLIENL